MTETEELRVCKDAYEREKRRGRALTGKLAEAEHNRAQTEEKLAKIKGSLLWRMSRPLRTLFHKAARLKERLGCYGSLKGIARKLNAKMIERQAREQHGSASFPEIEEAARQRLYKFNREVKFSILIPLYNTPEKFLRQAIESVMNQTYEGWELCLADGSDEEHAYVEQICREYMEKDKQYLRPSSSLYCRILYKKLSKNEGISGNTNACLAMSSGNYIALFDHDDVLHPCVLYEYMKVICEKGADYIYCEIGRAHV